MKPLEKSLLASFPFENWRRRRVCLAVSGGADSVALLCGFARLANSANLSKNLFVATVDHCSRGVESDGDVAFVRELSASLKIEFFERKIDVEELSVEARRQGSWEAGARTIRYRLLVEMSRRGGARFLATAHHRDDQLETLLFRLFRGAGFDGLRGIAPIRVLDESTTLVRPLLDVGRSEILDYLTSIGQSFRVDSSNASPRFARNRIRAELAPLLESIFPGRWENALLRLARLAEENENFFEKTTQTLDAEIENARRRDALFRQTLRSLNVPTPPEIDNSSNASFFATPLEPLRKAPEEVVRRYFRRIWREKNWPLVAMGADEWRRLAAVVRDSLPSKASSAQFPGSIFLTFPDPSTLRLERRPPNINALKRD